MPLLALRPTTAKATQARATLAWPTSGMATNKPPATLPSKMATNVPISTMPLPPVSFAKNDIAFMDPTGTDHDTLGRGLKKAIYNYMHGIGLEDLLQSGKNREL